MIQFKKFESTAELADTTSLEPLECWKGTSECVGEKSESYQKSWGGATLAECREYLHSGDPVAAAKIKAEGDIIAKKQGEGAPNLESGVYGCVPCVPNYLRGVPKNMLRVDRKYPRKPVIDIYVDTAIWDGVNLDRLAEAAAKVANVVTATERAGVRVNLYALVCAQMKKKGDYPDYLGFSVRVKDSRAPLNLLNIAFSLTNRALCRMVFCHWETCVFKRHVKGNGAVMSGYDVQ